jgi:acetyl-CoA carboxylase carboxyl transferase subunit alpha
MAILDFERPIIALRNKIEELKTLQDEGSISLDDEINKLELKTNKLEKATYSKLDSWQKTQLARHPRRPYTLDFIEQCTEDFIELHGDRTYRDDPSIVGGFCTLDGISFMVMGNQKGRNTADNVYRNFGSPHPEGYRKALRLMKMANKFRIPILTLIDTPGAYPGIGAEERGQSEAIAVNLREMSGLTIPIITVVIGEGGSGGALALGVSNRVLMFEHSLYSVISPEGCAGILWNDGSRAQDAAKALKYTAQDLIKFNIIDEIIPEPLGGAHVAPQQSLSNLKKAVLKHFKELVQLSPEDLIEDRYQKFRQMGEFAEAN